MISNLARVQTNCTRFFLLTFLLSILSLSFAAGTVIGSQQDGSDASLDGLLPVNEPVRTDNYQSTTQKKSNEPILVEGNTQSGVTANANVGLSTSNTAISPDYGSSANATLQDPYVSNESPSQDSSTVQSSDYQTNAQYSQVTATNPITTTSESYVLSAGDRISVSVFDEPELSVPDMTIPPDETINYPLIGQLALKGKTAAQIQSELASRLQEGFLVNPRVTVTVLQYRPFYIQGGVFNNGALPYEPGLTVDKAVALAGGLKDGVRLEDLKIGRGGAPYEQATPAQRSSLVSPGDVVYVPLANEGASGTYIYVYGEVNAPGRYQIYNSITVEQAIILAGGFTDFASKRKVDIKRTEQGEEVELKHVKLNEMIRNNDIITIGAGLF